MPKYEFVAADEKKLLQSEEFKNDYITKAIDDLNKTLGFAKCRGIKLEVLPEYQEMEDLVKVNGFVLRSYTVAKLINAGIVKIKEI